jgi:hypothetical protein
LLFSEEPDGSLRCSQKAGAIAVFTGTRTFIAVFAEARHLTLSCEIESSLGSRACGIFSPPILKFSFHGPFPQSFWSQNFVRILHSAHALFMSNLSQRPDFDQLINSQAGCDASHCIICCVFVSRRLSCTLDLTEKLLMSHW